MVQAYYTKSQVATAIMNRVTRVITASRVQDVLDLCAGSGRLTAAYRKSAEGTGDPPASLKFIEPETEPIVQLESLISGANDRIFNMTAEEFNLTYASPNQFDLILCNPPFGDRCGETEVGELVTDLHLPEITRFESYFLLTASVLSRRYLVFLMPNTYANHPECLTTFQTMESMGWDLRDLRELPINGYDHALVSTSMFIWTKNEPTDRWSQGAVELMKAPAYALYRDPCYVTKKGLHGPVHGYLWKRDIEAFSFGAFACRRHRQEIGSAEFIWNPVPKALGSTWERLGCIYELNNQGWEPANTHGYVNGILVEDDFVTAQQAFHLYRQGAVHSAQWAIRGIDLPALRQKYGHMPFGSFLYLLEDKSIVTCPLEADLVRLGVLHIGTLKVITKPSIDRIGPWLIDRTYAKPAQLCRLYLQLDLVPEWLQHDVEKHLRGCQIDHNRLELRSPWIPRSLVAEYLGLSLDRKGLFVRDRQHNQACGLLAYLNYGKGDTRIVAGDAESYASASHEFSIAMNDWNQHDLTRLRFQVHAHYLVSHSERRATVSGLQQIKPAIKLHYWQIDDVPFLLNGEAINNWDVGLGKTAGAMTVGASHPGKAFIAVPKPVLGKWQREFALFYPQIKVELLGFRPTKNNKLVLDMPGLVDQAKKAFFDPEVKVILTSHQVFGRLQISKREQLEADRDDAYDLLGSTDTERARTARSRFVKNSAARNFLHGGELTFSDLPLAQLLLIVDEGHQFKSLHPMPSAGWGNQLVMAGSCGKSKRARDMKIKADLIRQAGGKTLCLTATPITNSVAEAFNMLRIWAPSVLRQRGIFNTQQFIDQFCVMDPITAVSPTGKIVSGQTITGFRNLEPLRAMWESCMVTRTASDVGLPIPSKSEHVVHIEPTTEIRCWMNQQKQRLDEALKDDEKPLHIFQIISAIDTVASFPPCVGITSNPKADELVSRVLEAYRQTDGSQIIFSDRLESHDGLKDLLIGAGVQDKHIAIINAKTAPGIEQRLDIQEKYNKGTYRIVIGGAIASEGIDLQVNTVAMHFNNLTWDSQSIHQRIGRGVRQGNKLDQVQIYYYLLKGSTDIYRFATSTNKKHWWDGLRTCQTDSLSDGVFNEPVSDELIASIALDPEDAIAKLKGLRLEKEIDDQLDRFKSLLRKMLGFTDPQKRAISLPILRQYERSLRKLNHIPSHVIDEGLQRAMAVTDLRNKARKHKPVNWTQWVDKIDSHIQPGKTEWQVRYDMFRLQFSYTESCSSFACSIDELFRDVGTLTIHPSTFGPEPERVTRSIAAHVEDLTIDVVAALTPITARPNKAIRIQPIQIGEWVQPSLF